MTPYPVDPEIAAALLAEHLQDFFTHSPHVAECPQAWSRHGTDDPHKVVVGIPARSLDGVTRPRHHVLVDATCYDSWPPRVTFVEEVAEGVWRRARLGSSAYPLIAGSPGAPSGPQAPLQFALHDTYGYPDGRQDQLVCFSYSLDYYLSGHAPTDEQRWRPGRDRVDAALNRLYRVLNSASYLGSQSAEAA